MNEQTVQCDNCKRLHVLDSDGYVKFHGMLTVGEHGGLIGPQSIVWCRREECGLQLLAYLARFINLVPAD